MSQIVEWTIVPEYQRRPPVEDPLYSEVRRKQQQVNCYRNGKDCKSNGLTVQGLGEEHGEIASFNGSIVLFLFPWRLCARHGQTMSSGYSELQLLILRASTNSGPHDAPSAQTLNTRDKSLL